MRNLKKMRMFLRLENYERNKQEIDWGPYIKFEDMAIVCSIVVGFDDRGIITIPITWDLIKSYGMDVDMIFKKASIDSKKYFPAKLVPMEEVIKDGIIEEMMENMRVSKDYAEREAESTYLKMFGVMPEDVPDIYVMTNNIKVLGASSVFYNMNLLKDMAIKKNCDLILLPSSVHEMLILPMEEDTNLEFFESMVYDANMFVVENEDILSYCVFYYSLKENTIKCFKR